MEIHSLATLKHLCQVPEGATNIARFKLTLDLQRLVRSAEQIGPSVQLTLLIPHDQQMVAVVEEAAPQAAPEPVVVASMTRELFIWMYQPDAAPVGVALEQLTDRLAPAEGEPGVDVQYGAFLVPP